MHAGKPLSTDDAGRAVEQGSELGGMKTSVAGASNQKARKTPSVAEAVRAARIKEEPDQKSHSEGDTGCGLRLRGGVEAGEN